MGLNPVTPHLVDGEIIEPSVSVPIVNGSKDAAVAEADPADEVKAKGGGASQPAMM